MNHRNRSIFSGIIFVLTLGIALGQLISAGPVYAGEKEIVIGGSIPLSGGAAETGRNVYNGYKAAIKYVNEEYGGVKVGGETYKLKLDMFDDASDPSRATMLIQRQLDEGVDFFLGSFGSKIVLPTSSVTERAKKPMVQSGGGSDLIFTQGRKFVFGIFPRASRQFYTFRDFFNKLQKVKTFSIIYANRPFTKWSANGAKKTLEGAGYKILAFKQLPAQINDASSVLASIRANPPDVLMSITHDEPSMLIAKQMVTTNTYVKMLYFALGPQTINFRETLGKYANEVITAIYWDEGAAYKGTIIGTAKNFADYYRKHFKRTLTYHMASGASCIVAYVHAMQNANSINPIKVRDALDALDVMTFYGHLKFTSDGDAEAEYAGPLVAQLQKGKIEIIHPPAAATADLIYPMTQWGSR